MKNIVSLLLLTLATTNCFSMKKRNLEAYNQQMPNQKSKSNGYVKSQQPVIPFHVNLPVHNGKRGTKRPVGDTNNQQDQNVQINIPSYELQLRHYKNKQRYENRSLTLEQQRKATELRNFIKNQISNNNN